MSKKQKERVTCAVSDGECTAPAGVGISGMGWADGDGWAKAECWNCGDAVCGKCSRRIWRDGVRRRYCNTCIENNARFEAMSQERKARSENTERGTA